MFRKLLALEISALRQQLGELRAAPGEGAASAPLYHVLAALRDAASPGIWTLRRPV